MNRSIYLAFLLLLVAALSGCGDDPELNGRRLSEWLVDLEYNDLRVHQAAVDGLAKAGAEAVPWLLEAIDHSNENDDDIRIGCAHALLKIDAERHLPAMLELLEGRDPRMTLNVGTAMIRANVRPGRAVEKIIEVVQGDDLRLYNHGIKALSDLGPESGDAALVLGSLARSHAEADIRWRAAFALVRLGPAAKVALPDVLAALEDENAKVREGAAYALGAMQTDDPRVVASLETALNDSVATVRLRAAKSLEKIRS